MKKLSMILALLLTLNGCSYYVEVNDKSYVIAMGIDKGKNDLLKVSFMFSTPEPGTPDSGGGEKAKSKDIVTVEAPTVYSAIRLMNTFKSKEIDISHAKLVVFSEAVAKKGIKDFVTDFVNTRHFRPNIYLCVCQDSVLKFFESIDPKQDVFIEKYIDHLFGKVTNDDVNESYLYYTYFNLSAERGGTLLPLVGISEKEATDDAEKLFENIHPDDFSVNYTAKEIPIDGKRSAVLCGYAAFKEGKMVGELGLMESELIRMATDNLTHGEFSIYYPAKNDYVSINLHQTSPSKVKVTAGGTAQISLDIKLWCEFTGINNALRTQQDYKDFMIYINDVFTQKLSALMLKTRQEFGADVLNLGNYAKRRFLTNQQWQSYNWDTKYLNADIYPTVTITTDDYGELWKSP